MTSTDQQPTRDERRDGIARIVFEAVMAARDAGPVRDEWWATIRGDACPVRWARPKRLAFAAADRILSGEAGHVG